MIKIKFRIFKMKTRVDLFQRGLKLLCTETDELTWRPGRPRIPGGPGGPGTPRGPCRDTWTALKYELVSPDPTTSTLFKLKFSDSLQIQVLTTEPGLLQNFQSDSKQQRATDVQFYPWCWRSWRLTWGPEAPWRPGCPSEPGGPFRPCRTTNI